VAKGSPVRLAFASLLYTRSSQACGPLRSAHNAVVHGATARRRAVRSALGPGVTSCWGARASTALARARPWASARRSYVVPRSATCGGAAGFTFPATEMLDATAGTQIHHVTSASHGHGVPGAQHERGRRRKHTVPTQKSTSRRPIPRTVLAWRRRHSRA
jgi:hypothetical protein